jgi:hypothetical protein
MSYGLMKLGDRVWVGVGAEEPNMVSGILVDAANVMSLGVIGSKEGGIFCMW